MWRVKNVCRGRRKYGVLLGCATAGVWASAAQAIPTLQVGAPGGTGEGTYANYAGTLTSPTESDTAVTSGTTLLVAGAYKTQNSELLIGGLYTDPSDSSITPAIAPGTLGKDWSDLGFSTDFNGKGAVLMATVPDGTLTTGMTVNGNSPFFTTATFESGFVVPNPPSNHAPVQNQDYLFFDLGNFGMGLAMVPNFADESTSSQRGEIKTLTLAGTSSYDWVHFDVFALVTELQGGGPNVSLKSTLGGNPGSHDVTWKPADTTDDDDEPNPPGDQSGAVPEPATFGMGLLGLMGLGASTRRRRSA